ncbi:MAG TPA: SMP-30/gluconolactonase/LRE family protein [Pyrinomonadaceae bacterium]|nr:SMP-30/gluconolactonase/LRE family protein [Pyrinomonadaceae bacterium]
MKRQHWNAAHLLGGLLLVGMAFGCSSQSLSRIDVGQSSLVGPELKNLLAPGARLEMIASGFEFVEGPVWHPDGYLLFVDFPQSRIMKWHPNEGISIHREPTNGANGLVIDREGNVLACETGPPGRISRTGHEGAPVPVAENYQGKRLNSPNDLTIGADGAIYFTDPVFSEAHERRGGLGFRGVYKIGPSQVITLLANDFEWPNGIAISPDQQTLYVNDSARMHVRAFDIMTDGTVGNDRIFAELRPWAPHIKGVPDGMEVDSIGNLYVTGPGGVWVFNQDGKRLGIIATPEPPSNCAFGDEDMRTLYITGTISLFRIRLQVAAPTPPVQQVRSPFPFPRRPLS